MAEGSPVEEIRKDHETLKRDVKALGAAIHRVGRDARATQGALSGSLRDRLALFSARMRLHFRREEEALFRDAQRAVAIGARGAGILGPFFREEADDDLAAHAALRTHMQEMIALLDGVEWRGLIDAQTCARLQRLFAVIDDLLVRHSVKEDDLVFPTIERALTPAQRGAVLDRLADIAQEAGSGDSSLSPTGGLSGLDP